MVAVTSVVVTVLVVVLVAVAAAVAVLVAVAAAVAVLVAVSAAVAVAVAVAVAAVYFNTLKNHCHRFRICEHSTCQLQRTYLYNHFCAFTNNIAHIIFSHVYNSFRIKLHFSVSNVPFLSQPKY